MAKKFFTSDLETAGTLDVEGATTLSGTLAVTSGAQLNSTLGVAGATTLQGDLEVNGALDINVDGDMTIKLDNSTGVEDSFKVVDEDGGDLFKIYYSVTGAGTIQGYSTNVNTDFFCENLVALGETTLNDNVTINNGTLDVSGMASLDGGLTIDDLQITSTGTVNVTTNQITTTSGDYTSISGDITTGTGNINTGSGNLQSTSGNVIAGGYVETSKVAATQDLTLTCDSDDGSGGAGDTTSKIKFCKNSTDTEVASIDQYGTLSLGVNADSNYAKIQSTRVPGNNIELLASGSDNLFINSAGSIKLSPTDQVLIAANKHVQLGSSCNIVFPATTPGYISFDASNNTGYNISQTGINALGSQSIALSSGDLTVGGVVTFSGIVDDSNNSVNEYRVNLGTDNILYRTQNASYFSQGHIYHSTIELALGSAVSLANGSINLTQAANVANCVGIVAASQEIDETNTTKDSLGTVHTSGYLYKLASLGDSRYKQCNGFKVCNEGGALQPGDLLVTSSTPGYLMRQSDDIIRSKTVGKCMQAVTFDENGQAVDVYGYIYCG